MYFNNGRQAAAICVPLTLPDVFYAAYALSVNKAQGLTIKKSIE
jgi:hypothetical protein